MWTFPPRRLLAAVDFGDASSGAVRLAGELTRAFGGVLTVLHAESFEAPPYFTRDQVQAIEKQRRAARRQAADYLERHAAGLARIPVRALISDTAPAAIAILDAAREQDLILMGTHGRRGPARWWAGSVAERVVRESPVPVMVVRSAQPVPADVFRRIVVIARAGTNDGAARRYAGGLAETFGGQKISETASSLRAAALDDVSLVVVAQPGNGTASLVSGALERVLRTCSKPVLVVPCI